MIKNKIARYSVATITSTDASLIDRKEALKAKNGNIRDEDIFKAGLESLEKAMEKASV